MSPKPDLCPLCGKPTSPAHQPFCSQGCKDRDLLNWLGEAYATPVRANEEESASSGLDIGPEA
jgi:endogenous inhibitor of DNA gyrase (YacG/DUF329 family)